MAFVLTTPTDPADLVGLPCLDGCGGDAYSAPFLNEGDEWCACLACGTAERAERVFDRLN